MTFPGTGFGVTGGVFHSKADSRFLHFIRLPSISRGVTQEEWALPDLGFKIDLYSIDPDPDLLVVLEDRDPAYSW